MFTKSSASLLIAVLGFTVGLTGSTQAATRGQASETSSALALSYVPIIPQIPTLPEQPNLVPTYPIQPSLTPSIRVFPAPRPQIAVPVVRAVAVTGDDDGCTAPVVRKPWRPTPPCRPSSIASFA